MAQRRRPAKALLDRRLAFAKALKNLMAARGMTQVDLSNLLGGVTQSSISAWTTGESEPERETLFEVERHLGVRPGHLSQHLGFLPLSAGKIVTRTTEESILNDPALADPGKQVLLSTYQALVDGNRPARGRKPKRAS